MTPHQRRLKWLLTSFCLMLAILSSFSLTLRAQVLNTYWGECNLPPANEEAELSSLLSMCTQGQLFLNNFITDHRPLSNPQAWSKLYTSLYYGDLVSWHAQKSALFARLSKWQDKIHDIRTDLAAMQLGNPATHKIILLGGRKKLPFGANIHDFFGGINEAKNPRYFWDSPMKSIQITGDNQVNFIGQLGLAKTEEDSAASLRLTYDTPALNGTRLVFSLYSSRKDEDANNPLSAIFKEHRLGFATLNTGSNGSLFQFEWVRSQSLVNDLSLPFEQLLRLGFVGGYKNGLRPLFLYDDVRRKHRAFYFGQDYQLFERTNCILAASYFKDETKPKSYQWFFHTAIGFTL